jgi:MoaA/NifB/PqqE/SkfB family radical SAM enzyme
VEEQTAARPTRVSWWGARARPCTELLGNYLADVIALRTGRKPLRPLITNFYVTKRCNLRCRYCYPPGDEPEVDTPTALALLEKIRPGHPALNLTGGEPLLRADLPVLLQRAHELRFCPLLLSTNGLLIRGILDHLSRVDHLILSLDTLDERKGDAIMGVAGATREIVANTRLCARLAREKGYRLSLHTVITPEGVDDIPELVEFCASLGITLSVSPEHGRYDPHPALPGSPAYAAGVEQLIALKRQGRPVACSFGYLEAIRTFPPHVCYPYVSPRVEPDGRVYFPCQRMKQRYVHLQDYDTLTHLMRAEADPTETGAACQRRCYLACYLEVDQYLNHPWALLAENAMRRWVFTGARRAARATSAGRVAP